jgi:hypothetical protein
MGAALVLRTDDEVFNLAERISRSMIVPKDYRGKPGDIAVAVLYGQEIGLAPMTSLNRIVVIEGKPTLDAQGMSAVIRMAGHSLVAEVDSTHATIVGTRKDNGDTMTVTFTIEDAKRAELTSKSGWKKYPADMCFARAMSRIGRELFSDCLLGFSYTPEEADFAGTTPFSEGLTVDQVAIIADNAPAADADAYVPTTTRRSSPVPPADAKVWTPDTSETDAVLVEAEDEHTDEESTDAVIVEDETAVEVELDAAAAADLIERTFVAADGTGPVVEQALANEPEAAAAPTDGAGYPVTTPEINGLRYLLSHMNPPYRTDAEVNGFLGRTIGRADTSPRNLTRKEYERIIAVIDPK